MKPQFRQVREHIDEIAIQCGRSPQEIKLIVVTKNQSLEAIEEVYKQGCRLFAENRAIEALAKIPLLSSDVEWHLIGTLQSNKVNKVLMPTSSFALIHSVDSFALAQKLSLTAKQIGIMQPILLQINASAEISKHGFHAEECRKMLFDILKLEGIRVEGLMTMAPLSDDKEVIRACFRHLRLLREEFRELAVRILGIEDDEALLRHLSMGMSQDYPTAIEEGATLLRIGSAIFQAGF